MDMKLDYQLVTTIIQSYQGDIVDGKYQGEGKAVFKEGNTYEGQFVDSMMHGKGKYTWKATGITYEGDFENNQLNGFGKFAWPDGSDYEGEVKDGLRHGIGTLRCAKINTVYSGQWVAGKRHGEGTMTYNDSATAVNSASSDTTQPSSRQQTPSQKGAVAHYRGSWVSNMKEGFGVMHYASGNVYSGTWKADEKHGEGRMEWRTVHQVYVGEWQSSQPHGKGNYYWLKPQDNCNEHVIVSVKRNYYSGDWQAGKRHGSGLFVYADGSYYLGEWDTNKKHGTGSFVYVDGRPTYTGPFVNDRIPEKGPITAAVNKEQHVQLQMANVAKVIVERAVHALKTDPNVNFHFVTAPPPRPSTATGNNSSTIATSPSALEEEEIKQVQNLLLRYMSRLRDMYLYYSNLATPQYFEQARQQFEEDEACNLTLPQWCLFLKDSSITSSSLTTREILVTVLKIGGNTEHLRHLVQFSNLKPTSQQPTDGNKQPAENEFFQTSILFNTFLVWVVVVAYLKYGKDQIPQPSWLSQPQQPTQPLQLPGVLTFSEAVSQLFNLHIVKNSYRNRASTKSKKKEQLITKLKAFKQHIQLEQERKRRAGPSHTGASNASASAASGRLPSGGTHHPQPLSEQVSAVVLDDTKFDNILQDDIIPVDLPSLPEFWRVVNLLQADLFDVFLVQCEEATKNEEILAAAAPTLVSSAARDPHDKSITLKHLLTFLKDRNVFDSIVTTDHAALFFQEEDLALDVSLSVTYSEFVEFVIYLAALKNQRSKEQMSPEKLQSFLYQFIL